MHSDRSHRCRRDSSSMLVGARQTAETRTMSKGTTGYIDEPFVNYRTTTKVNPKCTALGTTAPSSTSCPTVVN